MQLQVGKIHSYDGEYAVIEFPDGNGVKEFEVPVCQLMTETDQSQHFPSIGTDVLIAYSEQEQPFLIGTYYTESNGRPFSSRDKFGFKFSDGTEISYDKSTGTLTASGAINTATIDSTAAVNVTAPTVNITGNLIVSGTITGASVAAGSMSASGSISAGGTDVGSMLTQIKTKYNAHTHSGSVPVPGAGEQIV